MFPVKEVLPPPVGTPLLEVPLAWRVWSSKDFWRRLECPEYVLDIVENGYRLPLVKQPSHVWRRNSAVCAQHEQFIDAQLEKLLLGGCVVEVRERPLVVCSLSVDTSRTNPRLIYNYRPVNPWLSVPKFRYESVVTARDMLPSPAYCFQFDVESAYPHIRTWRGHWCLLGFSWRGKFYVFCTLPFGLSAAPFVFSKVMRVLVRRWRAIGLRVMTMLDDGLGGAHSFAEAQRASAIVRSDLESAGLTPHAVKSRWLPAQRTDAFLGFAIDFAANTIALKRDRVVKILRTLLLFARDTPPTRRQVASLAGQIISSHMVLGHVVRIRTRALYHLIADYDASWDSVVPWTPEAWSEVVFWRAAAIDGFIQAVVPFRRDPLAATVTVSSDASDGASGVVLRMPDSPPVGTACAFSPEQRLKSSTWRELEAVRFGLVTFAHILRDRVVRWETDNQAAAFIIIQGSKWPHLNRLAKAIYEAATAVGAVIRPIWVPRELNEQADAWSRTYDIDDWGLSDQSFQILVSKWGRFSADLFADHINKRCSPFWSRWPCPGSSGTDAITASWPPGLVYACPPFSLLSRFLPRVMSVEAPHRVVLVVPLWPAQSWWPLLFSDGVHTSPSVVDAVVLCKADFQIGRVGRPDFLIHPSWSFAAVALLWQPGRVGPSVFCSARALGKPCPLCTVFRSFA